MVLIDQGRPMKKLIFVLLFSPMIAAASVPESARLASAVEIVKQPIEAMTQEKREQLKPFYDEVLKIAASNSQSIKLRWKALILAAKIKPDMASKDIAAFAKHEDWFMRNATLTAVQEVNLEAAKKVAEELLKDKALVVRSAAVDVLSQQLSAESRERLWNELNQKYNFKGTQSLWIRSQIVESLNRNPRDEEIRRFSKALFDKDQAVRAAAVVAMEKITKTVRGKSPKTAKNWQEFAKQSGYIE